MRYAALDLSGPYRSVFDTTVPHATQVADPFHVIKLANLKLDECRRRVQNEREGHRGRKRDPLYRGRDDHHDAALALEFVQRLGHDLQDPELPEEARSLGRILLRWKHQIAAWHEAHMSNRPTEAANNLIKRVKRVALGFRRFRNYRIRALLYAGKPNWSLLATVAPR